MPTVIKPNFSYPDADRETVFEEGLEFQDFVVDLFLKELGIPISNYSSRYYQSKFGENRQGIEIKLDRRITKKDKPDEFKVSIEVAEKVAADRDYWTDSGIIRNDNTWLYIQGNYDVVFVFSKSFLRQLYKARYFDKVRQPKETIKTFLMPFCEAEKYALKVFYINKELFPLKLLRD